MTAAARGRAILELFAEAFAAERERGEHLPEPWIAAAPDGSIGLDWSDDGTRLAITCTPSGRVEWYAASAEGEYEGEGSNDIARLAAWFLSGRRERLAIDLFARALDSASGDMWWPYVDGRACVLASVLFGWSP